MIALKLSVHLDDSFGLTERRREGGLGLHDLRGRQIGDDPQQRFQKLGGGVLHGTKANQRVLLTFPFKMPSCLLSDGRFWAGA